MKCLAIQSSPNVDGLTASCARAVLDGFEAARAQRIPLIKMVNCPNCDGVVGKDQIFCSSCGLLLDEKIQIEKVEDMRALREEVDELRRLLKRTLDIAIGTPSSYDKRARTMY